MSKEKIKGDLLELMIIILEKSLIDNPTTVIKSKYKLKDRDGVLREVDIYVETTVNKKLLRYAFECKNYKKGVQLIHIVDFHSKIADLGIQGLFVTTSNYQKGAIAKAKALNIDLLNLKKKVAGSYGITGLIFLHKQFKIKKISIIGKEVSPDTNIDNILQNCNVCKQSIVDTIENNVIPYLFSQLDKGMESLYPEYNDIKNIAPTINEENAKSISAYVMFEEGTCIIHNGMEVPYHLMVIEMKVWNKLYEQDVLNGNSFSYIKHNDEGLLATFSFSEFLLQNKKMIASITKIEGGDTVLSLGDPSNVESIDIHEGVCIGTIDELGLKDLLLSNDSSNH